MHGLRGCSDSLIPTLLMQVDGREVTGRNGEPSIATSFLRVLERRRVATPPVVPTSFAPGPTYVLRPVPKTPSWVFYGLEGVAWRDGSPCESSSLRRSI